jgi:hypothetical protein
MMFIKTRIFAIIHGLVNQHKKVCDLLNTIDDQFITLDKALTNTLIIKFSSIWLSNVRCVLAHHVDKGHYDSLYLE